MSGMALATGPAALRVVAQTRRRTLSYSHAELGSGIGVELGSEHFHLGRLRAIGDMRRMVTAARAALRAATEDRPEGH